MCVTKKAVMKLPNVYIITCVSQGKLLKSWGMYISSRVNHKESCYKVGESICHHVCITRKVVIKLGNVYIITRASQGKSLQSCGMHISSHVHYKESCYKLGK